MDVIGYDYRWMSFGYERVPKFEDPIRGDRHTVGHVHWLKKT